MSKGGHSGARPAREVAEEAVHLLRAAPIAAWGAYYLGAVPFCVALVYFVNAMEVYAFAERDLPFSALVLSGLFVWMKTWQARFAGHLLGVLQGEPVQPWRGRAVLRSIYNQTVLQTTGIFVLPIAFLTMILFVPAYGFYQSATALDAAGTVGSRELLALSQRETMRWQKQAYVLQWMLSPAFLLLVGALTWLFPIAAQGFGVAPEVFLSAMLILLVPLMLPLCPLGVVVAINLVGLVFFAAMLMKSFLDIESIFTWAQGAALNRAFITAVLAGCYLTMDPLIKAAYVLRCYYGLSLRTGEDLRSSLHRLAAISQAAAVLTIALTASLLAAAPARADDSRVAPPSAAEINAAVQQELKDPVYTWRMPRVEVSQSEQDENFIVRAWHRFTEWLKQSVADFFSWLRELFRRMMPDPPDAAGTGAGAGTVRLAMEIALVVLAIALVAIVAVVAMRQWKSYRQDGGPPDHVAVATTPVKIDDESARADALPEDRWLQMAREFQAQGEYRFAMRALFLAMLSSLASRGMIQIVRYKSNLDYQREVKRRIAPETFAAFREGVLLYECVWYGDHFADESGCAQLLAAEEKVRTP